MKGDIIMLAKYKNLLTEIYEQYQSTGQREFHVDLLSCSREEKQDFINCYGYLNDCGYVDTIRRAFGFYEYKLTPYGITFVENGYSDPAPAPTLQGNNNIVVQGSNNAITNNYNQISTEIENSELSDECKQLIESLLYDLQNPHITPAKKSERIKSFLHDIASDTLSETATSGLTTLLMSLFSKILI